MDSVGPDRTRETLLPLIESWCRCGSVIASDGWRAYQGLDQLGFEHRVVVHENGFVDPITGVHTNCIENYWQRCKRKLKRIYGSSIALLPTHIDEFLWNERYGKTISDRWRNFFRTMISNYN